jgi:hypothetical protein
MEALFLVAGAALAFAASLVLQREERRSATRSRIYLDLLPELQRRATHYNHIADQDPETGNAWFLKDNDWPYLTEADAIHRHAMLLTKDDAAFGIDIRDCWMAFARAVDPDYGSVNELILGDARMAAATKAVMDSVAAYSAWIEQRNRGRVRGRRSPS